MNAIPIRLAPSHRANPTRITLLFIALMQLVASLRAHAGDAAVAEEPLMVRMQSLHEKLNRPIRVAEFETLSRSQMHTSREWTDAWKWLRENQQTPVITREDLMRHASQRREALTTLQCKYHFKRTYWDPEPKQVMGDCEFAFTGVHAMFVEKRTANGKPGLPVSWATDGIVTRKRLPYANGDDFNNFTEPATGLDRFYEEENPLVLSWMVDSRRRFKNDQSDHDLAALFESGLLDSQDVLIQSQPEEVNGQSCLVIAMAPALDRLYLGINQGFAVVRFESRVCGESLKSPGQWDCVETRTYDLSDFQVHGGLHLPATMSMVLKRHGVQVESLDVAVKVLSVNQELDTQRLLDIFAFGSTVYDTEKKVHFDSAANPTTANLLRMFDNRRERGMRWSLSVGTLVVAALIAAVYVARRGK